MIELKNKSTLIIEKEKHTDEILKAVMPYISKIIVVDGENYNVVKSRHGLGTQNGHISFLTQEIQNK